jgi:hypothetical protein
MADFPIFCSPSWQGTSDFGDGERGGRNRDRGGNAKGEALPGDARSRREARSDSKRTERYAFPTAARPLGSRPADRERWGWRLAKKTSDAQQRQDSSR